MNVSQNSLQLLRTIPWPPDVKRNDRFRNPAGVRFKLQNLQSVETKRGLKNISTIDRIIMAEYANKPEVIKGMAGQIRLALQSNIEGMKEPYFDDDIEFSEGRILTEIHKRRERHPGLRKALIAKRRKDGGLRCEICDWTCPIVDKAFHESAYEAHHLWPLSAGLAIKTKFIDLALLCATCHRLVHRAIALEKRWLSLEECRLLLSAN